MEGVGEGSSPHRGSCPLSARGEWLASWTPQPSSEEARRQHPGAEAGARGSGFCVGGIPSLAASRGHVPFPQPQIQFGKSNATLGRGGCLPLLIDNRGSLTFPPTAGPLPATDRPLFTALGSIQVSQTGSEQGAKKEEASEEAFGRFWVPQRRRVGVPNLRRRGQATGEMLWFCLWLRF